MITLDLSILNQKGTPMFNSDLTANRPAAGIVGRIFIAIDAPYGIFRDTGSAWDQVSGAGSFSGSLATGQVAFGSALNTIAGTNNLFWDSANNRLGINTNTPTGSLQVAGGDAIINTINIGLGGGSIANNTRIGVNALNANTTGTSNIAFGSSAMLNNTTGINNVVLGTEALLTSTTGSNNNVIVGRQAAYFCTGIVDTIAIGAAALSNSLNSQRNIAIGRQSMINSVSGNDNTALGYRALYGMSTSTYANNTAIGSNALGNMLSGGNNIAIGYNAGLNAPIFGSNNTTSTNSIYLGYQTSASANGNTNEIVIGYDVAGLGSNTISLGNSSTIFGRWYGRLLTGTSIDTGQQFQVLGNSYLRGSTTLSGTTSNDTTTILRVEQNGGNGRFLVNALGQVIIAGDGNQASENFVSIARNAFNPTSGGTTHASLFISPTINQTGTATGGTRGILIQPTLTSAFDWRSIEWANNTGWGLYGQGTALNYLGGTLGIKTTSPYAPSTFSLDVNGGLLVKNTGSTTAQITLINADPSIGGNNGFLVASVGGTSGGSYVDFQGYYGTSVVGSTALRLNPSGGAVIVNSTTNTGEQFQLTGTLRINGQSSGTAGGSSGQHLIINLDGTTYKIALLNP